MVVSPFEFPKVYMVRQWFDMGTFRFLPRMQCNPILAVLETIRLVEVHWYTTGVEWFPFEYERSKFIFLPSVSWVTRKCAEGTEAAKADMVKSVLLYRE